MLKLNRAQVPQTVVSEDEIKQWLTNSITERFFLGVRVRLERMLEARANGEYFIKYDPAKNSELNAEVAGRTDELARMLMCGGNADIAEEFINPEDPDLEEDAHE